ncbi:MAG: hypothetical protein IID53_13875 [Proteobacteria bacterium]|nr:hypothetical protein [Pseudomonadota bacterium]
MARELKNKLINHIQDRQLNQYAAIYLNDQMIDIGCGAKPYKKILVPYVTEHIGVDHEDTSHDKSGIGLFGTAYEIPGDVA